ncbi:MAG: DNA topoisomerase VI subunit B [Planctomycetes bacterium]|nr:DNA topoisomerase VI subunit B [Planctomycetota bacterium]
MSHEGDTQGTLFPSGAADPTPTSAGRKPKGGDAARGTGGGSAAERMARQQREISVSEFFTKNRHLLGFDSPRKALLTAVKEAVDNSLDACEEARIVPDLQVEIRAVQGRENTFTVIVEDNGPGIVPKQVPNVFGRLLYGSKFHRLRQSRGQQGIGIAAAGMYSQLTTGNPMRITSRIGRKALPYFFTVRMDTTRNRPEFTEKVVEWDKDHGTRVEIDLEGEYRRGQRSVEEFLKLVALANPHVRIAFKDPEGVATLFDRATTELPKETEEIKPHPHGVELGQLIKMLQDTEEKWVHLFLQRDFSRVGPKVAEEICAAAKINPRANPRVIVKEDADRLKKAIDQTRIMAPPTSCIAPIGEELMLKGLRKEVEADFYVATSRSPVVYRGRPFLVEVGIAFGRPGDTLLLTEEGKIVEQKKKVENQEALMGNADEPVRLIRYANRVPLMFQQSACAISKSVIATNWRNYGLQQPRGALPIGPMVLMVHIASVWVPFTSESKEAIAGYDEIFKEIRLGIQECARKLGTHIRKGRKLASEFKKRGFIEKYIPHIGQALKEILSLDDRQVGECVGRLTTVLEKSRKL